MRKCCDAHRERPRDPRRVLYDLDTGLVTLAVFVKKYVKALFGAASPQYDQVSGLKFRYVDR
ncbi:MAG: hypothetical protein WBD16_00595 [Pyrinomonadaceae bacterium]